jgi:excisionase family DNA binding protein
VSVDRELLTVAEAASALELSVRTVQARLERCDMQGERVHRHLWLIPRSEVERLRGRGKFKTGPKPRSEQEGDSSFKR